MAGANEIMDEVVFVPTMNDSILAQRSPYCLPVKFEYLLRLRKMAN